MCEGIPSEISVEDASRHLAAFPVFLNRKGWVNLQSIKTYLQWKKEEEEARSVFKRRYPAEKDPYRQRFHLMPPVGFLNDPNGLCFFRGIYHVYHQYRPFDPAGDGAKLWGHYGTKDFISWHRFSPAGAPDTIWDRDGMYSGSALGEKDGIHFYYTGNVKKPGDFDYIYQGREHNLIGAFSSDGRLIEQKKLLMANEDYPEDMTLHVRDPKVWKEDGQYYMVLGARSREDRGQVLLYTGEDGLKWRLLSRFSSSSPLGYMWECPDLFPLGGKHILIFCPQGLQPDGMRFHNGDTCGYTVVEDDFRLGGDIPSFEELDRGFDFYAAQTFSGTGARKILLGWMGLPAPHENPTVPYGWQHCLSIPRELTFKRGKLWQEPLKELSALRGSGRKGYLHKGEKTRLRGKCFEALVYPDKGNFHLAFRQDAELIYDGKILTFRLGKSGFGRKERKCCLPDLAFLRIFSDVSSLEIFADGEVFSTRLFEEEGESGIQELALWDGFCRWEMYPLHPFVWDNKE